MTVLSRDKSRSPSRWYLGMIFGKLLPELYFFNFSLSLSLSQTWIVNCLWQCWPNLDQFYLSKFYCHILTQITPCCMRITCVCGWVKWMVSVEMMEGFLFLGAKWLMVCHAIGSPTLQQGTTILSLSKIYSLASFWEKCFPQIENVSQMMAEFLPPQLQAFWSW